MRTLLSMLIIIYCTRCLGANIGPSETSVIKRPASLDFSDDNSITIQILDQNDHENCYLKNVFQQGRNALTRGDFKMATSYFDLLPIEDPEYRYWHGAVTYKRIAAKENKIRGLLLIISAADLGNKTAKTKVQMDNLRGQLCRLLIDKDEFTSTDSDHALRIVIGQDVTADYLLAKKRCD